MLCLDKSLTHLQSLNPILYDVINGGGFLYAMVFKKLDVILYKLPCYQFSPT